MKLIIFGPQASGKGTQAEKLAQEYNLKHVSPGAIMRHEIEQNTILGQKVKPYLEQGQLVPTNVILEIIQNALKNENDFILDGFPRDIEQALAFDKILSFDKAIFLKVPDKVSKERIQGRRECEDGHDYHILYKPPKIPGICDEDGKKLHMREDDKDNILNERLRIYHENTEEVIRHYESLGKIITINGDQTIEEVHQAIQRALN